MKRYIILFCSFLFMLPFFAQTRTVGLIQYPSEHEHRYYLFSPLSSKNTYLTDDCGRVIRKWTSQYTSGASQLLTTDGYMIRCGAYLPPRYGPGAGGVLEKFDWDGNIVWSITIADTTQCLHHDICLMPNGNILAIAWENKTKAEAIEAGRRPQWAPATIWPEKIIEIKPKGTNEYEIVWEWKAWDHLIQQFDSTKANYGVTAEHPELIAINYYGSNQQDWMHINSVDYNPELDQILLSVHSTDEIYIIDHSTTTAQAAGHTGGKYGKGGDLLYRWGNPVSYFRGAAEDRKLFKQHHAHWIPKGYENAGKIMIFNNGLNRTGTKYSTIDILDPPQSAAGVYTIGDTTAFGPDSAEIFYKAPVPSDFYSTNLSGAHHIGNNEVLATLGASGTFVEIDGSKNIVWKYINPETSITILKQGETPNSNAVFRCIPYPSDYAGFKNKNMTPQVEIEQDPYSPSLCVLAANKQPENIRHTLFSPNPATHRIQFASTVQRAEITALTGQVVMGCTGCSDIDITQVAQGHYVLRLFTESETVNAVLIHE